MWGKHNIKREGKNNITLACCLLCPSGNQQSFEVDNITLIFPHSNVKNKKSETTHPRPRSNKVKNLK